MGTPPPPYPTAAEPPEGKIEPAHMDGNVSSLDQDAAKLAEMGYTQDLERNFNKWSLLGVTFALTNSWFGISASLVTGINSGGPIVIVYGIIWIAMINGCVAISLAELVSAMPNSGGQYYWVSVLAPSRHKKFFSYLTGAVGYAGSIFTSASVALAIGNAFMGMIQLNHPDLVIKRWMVFVAGSTYLARVHPQLGIPFEAHTASCFIVALLGHLYIGSTTAFNSMVTACIVLLYISYAVPAMLLLTKGRDNIKHGPFFARGTTALRPILSSARGSESPSHSLCIISHTRCPPSRGQ